MKLDIKKNTIRGSLLGVLFKISSLIFPFIIRTIIIKNLGSEYAGLGNLFASLLQVLSLAELGFGSAMVFAMYKYVYTEDKQHLRALLNYYKKMYFIIGVIVLFVGLLILFVVPYLIHGDIPNDINVYSLFAIYLLNTVFSYSIFAYRGSILAAYQRQDVVSIISLCVNVFLYLTQIVLLVFTKNYYLYCICLPICTILNNYITYIVCKRMYPDIYPDGEICKKEKKEIFTKIRALFLHKIGGIILNSADTIVISSFLGLVILSDYNNYYYLLSAISGFIMIIFSSITAGIGNSLLHNDIMQKEKRFFLIYLFNGLLVSICTCCFFSLYQPFIEIWVGADKLFDFSVMVLFCIYFYIHMIRRTILMYRDAAGLWCDNKWQPIVSAIFNLVLNLVLVRYINIYGILLSSILAQILIDIPWESIKTIKSLFTFSWPKYFLRLLLFSISTVLSCVVIYLITKIIMVNIYVLLIINAIISILVSGIIFAGSTLFLPESKELMKIVVNKIRKQ